LSGVYEGNYYQAIYGLQVGTGMAFSFVLLNDNAIRQAITYPLANEQFSDRIWSNRTLLVKELRQTITEGLIKGYGNQKMARILKDKVDSNYSNALRLVRTETNYIMGKATIEGYKQSGIVSQYKIVIGFDERTCDKCQAKDGKVYKLEEYEPALTGLPFHPNCRCKLIPFFSDEDLKESQRIARGKDGEYLYVPASMTYKEFQEKYLRGVPS
jgi:SPP1 gp7 family putative phage head morphogenesis protein